MGPRRRATAVMIVIGLLGLAGCGRGQFDVQDYFYDNGSYTQFGRD